MENETNTATEGTPTPEAVTTTAPVAENTNTEKASTEQPKGDNLPKGVKERLYKLSSKVREQDAKIKELEAIRSQVANKETTDTTGTDFLDDPYKHLATRDKQLRESIKAELRADQENSQRVVKAQEAATWLMGHPDINGDIDAIAEMEETINTNPYYQKLASVDPMLAAEKVLEAHLSAKGMSVSRKSAANTEQKAATGSKAHATATTVGVKTAETIKKELASIKMSDPDYTKKMNSLLEEVKKL